MYRGAAPIQQVILDGQKETGVTTMFMDEGLDIQSLVHKHGGDAGFLLSIQNHLLDRGGAPVHGKQGGMNIDAALFRHRQNQRAGGKNISIRR